MPRNCMKKKVLRLKIIVSNNWKKLKPHERFAYQEPILKSWQRVYTKLFLKLVFDTRCPKSSKLILKIIHLPIIIIRFIDLIHDIFYLLQFAKSRTLTVFIMSKNFWKIEFHQNLIANSKILMHKGVYSVT